MKNNNNCQFQLSQHVLLPALPPLKSNWRHTRTSDDVYSVTKHYASRPVTRGTSTSTAGPKRYFEWFFNLLARSFRICWSSKYWMRFSWSTRNKKCDKTKIWTLTSSSPSTIHFISKCTKKAMPIILNMVPYKPVQLLWGLSYDSFCKGSFSADFGHSLMLGHSWLGKNNKICQKQPFTATAITQPT